MALPMALVMALVLATVLTMALAVALARYSIVVPRASTQPAEPKAHPQRFQKMFKVWGGSGQTFKKCSSNWPNI